MTEQDQGWVDVGFPASPEAAVLARLQVGGVGRMIDLGVDEIAELRLAVEELCIDARGHAHTEDPRVRLRLEWDHGSIWASCIVADGTPSLAREADVSTFSEQIISALVEEHGVEVTDGVRRSWLRIKRASR